MRPAGPLISWSTHWGTLYLPCNNETMTFQCVFINTVVEQGNINEYLRTFVIHPYISAFRRAACIWMPHTSAESGGPASPNCTSPKSTVRPSSSDHSMQMAGVSVVPGMSKMQPRGPNNVSSNTRTCGNKLTTEHVDDLSLHATNPFGVCTTRPYVP